MKRYAVPGLIFIASMTYYISQACPTFYFWDSAELTSAVLTNGVPHPPGFPFFLIFAKIWTWLIPLSKDYALNLFSLFFASLGLTLWYLAIKKMLEQFDHSQDKASTLIISAIATALLGISLTYSIQAVRLEVYSLNFAAFAAIFLLAVNIANRENNGQSSIILFILIGLSLGIHNLTIALTIPGIILILLLGRKIKLSGIFIGLLSSIILALSLYGIIFYFASQRPALNWGDPSNISRLLDYILIRGFNLSDSGMSPGHINEQIGFVWNVLSRQVGVIGILFSLAGIIILIARKHQLAAPLICIFVLNCASVVFAKNYFYENYDLHGYLVISVALAIIFIAVTLLAIYKYAFKRLSANKTPRPMLVSSLLSAVIIILLFAIPLKENLFSADLSKTTSAREYAREFLDGAPADAVIITSSYNTYFCCQACQALNSAAGKPAILNLYDWDHQWGREETARILNVKLKTDLNRQVFYRAVLNEVMKNRPVYIEYDEASVPLTKYLKPMGLGYLLSPDEADSSAVISANDSQSEYADMLNVSELESIRTMLLWLEWRAKYYETIGNSSLADRYYELAESLAGKADLK